MYSSHDRLLDTIVRTYGRLAWTQQQAVKSAYPSIMADARVTVIKKMDADPDFLEAVYDCCADVLDIDEANLQAANGHELDEYYKPLNPVPAQKMPWSR